MASARSRIAKGRAFQKRVMEIFKTAFGLTDEEIRTPVGAENGPDVIMTKTARAKVGIVWEAKDHKSLNMWSAIKQAQANCPSDCEEAVIFKRGDLGSFKTFIAVPLSHYINLRRALLLQKEED